jgi:hypothetical protein
LSLSELLPIVQALPRPDQVRLVHFLIDELARPMDPDPELKAAALCWGLHQSSEAAAILQRLLEENKNNPNHA